MVRAIIHPIPHHRKPEITIELTEEGCLPEHDVLQERVIILSRAKKFKGGQLIEEGTCERTLEHYPVKRDYECEHCQDEIDTLSKKSTLGIWNIG